MTIAPRTWKGNTPASVNDGYNYCFAANIAYRAGLSKIELKKVDFAQLVTGRLKGFDIAMDDIYIKPEREAKIDFSIPYGASWTGISGRTDDPLTKDKLKDLKFAVTLGSVQQQWVENVLKANQKPNTYDDTVELFAALRAKQVDAVAIDMPVSLPAAAASGGAVKVYGQVKVGGQVGIVMEQGNPNRKAINAIVKEAQGERHAARAREEVLLRRLRRSRPEQASLLGVESSRCRARRISDCRQRQKAGASGDWRPRRGRCPCPPSRSRWGRRSRSGSGCGV